MRWHNRKQSQHIFVLQQSQYLDFPQSSSYHPCSEILQNYFLNRHHLIITLTLPSFTLYLPFFCFFTFNGILYLSSNYYAIGTLSDWAYNLVVISDIEYSSKNNTSSICFLYFTILHTLSTILFLVVNFGVRLRARILLFLLKSLHC